MAIAHRALRRARRCRPRAAPEAETPLPLSAVGRLTDALLFGELEGKGDKFHVGYWLSVYDEAQAKALETPATRAFRRIHESLPESP